MTTENTPETTSETEAKLEAKIDPTDRKSVTVKLIAAALALVGEIKAMQANRPNWFGDFSTWEYLGGLTEEADMMQIEWPNLAIVLKDLEAAIQAVKDLVDTERRIEIEELTRQIIDNHG